MSPWLERQLIRQAELQKRRRQYGLCVRCGCPTEAKPTGGRYARCEEHRLEQAWWRKKLPGMPAHGWRFNYDLDRS